MTRWISSALCTMVLVAVLVWLPVWDIRRASTVASATHTAPAMSAVQIVKRAPRPAPPAVQPIAQKQKVPPKNVPAIPAPVPKPVPQPEPETVPTPEESPEVPDEPDTTPATDVSNDDATASGEPSDEAVPAAMGESGATDGPSTAAESVHVYDAKAAAYKSYALGRIASKKTYPYRARSNGLEGRVRIRIVINPDGSLAHVDILEPSEHDILNNACLTAIKKAAPFKKMSAGMTAMTLSFVMDFSLK